MSGRWRRGLRLIIAAQVLGLLVPAPPVAHAATFSNSASIAIPAVGAASPYPSEITVSGLSGTVAKVTVTLTGLTHTAPGELDILLVGPAGQTVLLMSDAGLGFDVAGLTLTFDDAATAQVPFDSRPTSGTYKPTNYGVGDPFPSPTPAGPYAARLAAFTGIDPNGTWKLFVLDDRELKSGSIANGWSLEITVAPNASPTIANIADQATDEDTSTGAIPLTINDDFSPILTLVGSSSNPTLVPNGNIAFGGTGANRTMTVTPAANQSGTATITVTVDDGFATASDSFVLTVTPVNDRPTISEVPDQAVAEDGATSAIPFVVGDVETPPGSLTVTATSSNQALVPNGNVVLGGAGANRTVTVTPVANQTGAATITLTVSDGALQATDTFVLTVGAASDPPTISPIANRAIDEDTSTGPIGFTVGDVETDPAALVVTASSDNAALVPAAGLVLGGGGAERTLTVTPAPDQSGAAEITLTVTDGAGATATEGFVLVVRDVPEPSAPAPQAPTNAGPVAQPDSYAVALGRPLVVAGPGVLANDADADRDALSAALVTRPARGRVALDSDGGFIYVPGPAFRAGSDRFTYRVSDGRGGAAAATATIAIPTCFGKPATHVGTPGNDVLVGTPGDDVMVGLGGNDRIRGLGGNDRICGGDGNDRLLGEVGDDLLDGEGGADTLDGGPGKDTLRGGAGNDVLLGGPGDDRALGGPGNDTVRAGAGHDRVAGEAGDDVLNGDDGNDALVGGPGRDRCGGGPGTDTAGTCEAVTSVP